MVLKSIFTIVAERDYTWLFLVAALDKAEGKTGQFGIKGEIATWNKRDRVQSPVMWEWGRATGEQ